MSGKGTPNPRREAALGYARIQLHVHPVGRDKQPLTDHGWHDASIDEDQIRAWWRRWPDADVAIALPPSGLAVLDLDAKHGGPETFEAMSAYHGPLPDTPEARTGGGGAHYVFNRPDVEGIRNRTGDNAIAPGVEFIVNGYIIVEPSLHESGRCYEWRVSPFDLPPEDVPPWLLALALARPERPALPMSSDGNVIPDGTRNSTLARCAGAMQRRGMSEAAILAALQLDNAARCQPPLPDREVERIVKSITRYAPDDNASAPVPGPRVRSIAEIEPEEVEFLWRPYIPLRRLSLLSGDPGVGKSWISLAIATAASTGIALPGCTATEPAKVLLLTAEDGLGDTVRPRLDRMGADLGNVFALETTDTLSSGEGLLALEEAIAEYQPLLVVIDPLVAYMGAKVDMHRANEARSVMSPLARLAERYGCAILGVRHLRKGTGGRAIYAGLGSIDFTAAVRSEIMAGSDPENPASRAIAHVKCNVAEHGPPIGFAIEDGAFRWTGKTTLTADRMLASADMDGLSAVDEAEAFLQDLLAAGPVPHEEVQAEARGAGISMPTLKRAKQNLKVKSKRQSEPGQPRGKGGWIWTLSTEAADQGDQGDQESLHGTVDPLDPLEDPGE